VKDALRALAEVIGEAPVSGKAKGAAQAVALDADDALTAFSSEVDTVA